MTDAPSPRCSSGTETAVVFWYKNYKGEQGYRRAIPISIRYGTSDYHHSPQWLMLAFDTEKRAEREFAMSDMSHNVLGHQIVLRFGGDAKASPTPQIVGTETEQQLEDRLMKQDAADNLRLLDYIAHKIGLPINEEMSRENFSAWFNSLSPQVQAGGVAQASTDQIEIKRLNGLLADAQTIIENYNAAEIARVRADVAAHGLPGARARARPMPPEPYWLPFKVAGGCIRDAKDNYVAELSSPFGGDIRDQMAQFLVAAANASSVSSTPRTCPDCGMVEPCDDECPNAPISSTHQNTPTTHHQPKEN